MSEKSTDKIGPWWGRFKDIVTVCVIPAMAWVNSINSDLASQKQQLETTIERVVKLMEKEESYASRLRKIDVEIAIITDYKKRFKELENKEASTALGLAKIETKLENIGESFNEIRQLVLSLNK